VYVHVVLEETERRPTLGIEGDDLAVEDRVTVAERGE